jgi:hypothetical protein
MFGIGLPKVLLLLYETVQLWHSFGRDIGHDELYSTGLADSSYFGIHLVGLGDIW